jgi:hypothetical protein
MRSDANVHRYTARIDGLCIGEDLAYEELVERTLEFILRAAIAMTGDDFSWEQEELRRGGLREIAFSRNGKALWWDAATFEAEQREAGREHIARRFAGANELDPAFLDRLDRDLTERLRQAGYATPSLVAGMKELFHQLVADANDRSAEAVESIVTDVLGRKAPAQRAGGSPQTR